MKRSKIIFGLFTLTILLVGCNIKVQENETLADEQNHTETNQKHLNTVQPAPTVEWSLERDNLIKRFQLMNDRTVVMYMYLFIEGVGTPIGYYQVNKISSVNSQLTNPAQVVDGEDVVGQRDGNGIISMPSPAEDGSYGSNGDAVFGFTPDGLYIEHNMKYITSTAPLLFPDVPMIGKISIETSNKLKDQLKSYE